MIYSIFDYMYVDEYFIAVAKRVLHLVDPVMISWTKCNKSFILLFDGLSVRKTANLKDNIVDNLKLHRKQY